MTTLSEMSTAAIEREWTIDNRWAGIERPYEAADVVRLRGSVRVEYSLARRGSEKLWKSLHRDAYVSALGASSGAQAVEMVEAGVKAICVSGWQVAAEANLSADANLSEQAYPDQRLYAATNIAAVVRQINRALRRADQIDWAAGLDHETTHGHPNHRDWLVPIVADAEAGSGGALNAFELMKAMIEAGAAGVHFGDQLSSERPRGHTAGKGPIPTGEQIRTLSAARLAADVCGVPTLLVARTDVNAGIEIAVARALAYAPYSDLIWCETSTPDLEEAQVFAQRIHERFPGKLMAYNCSPAFSGRPHPDDATTAGFQRELAAMGYALQFATGHPHREVGAGYFDDVVSTVSSGLPPALALAGSTQEHRF